MPTFTDPEPISVGGNSISGDVEVSQFDNIARIVSIPSHVVLAANRMPPGDPGLSGEDGSPGPPGLTGSPGSTGPQGAAGTPGAPGEPGIDGESGLPGIPGPQGPAGSQGPGGPAGAPGPSGDPGDPGDAGPPGQAGADGATGATGAQGLQGIPGFSIPGDTGEQGDTGFPGIPGPQGAQGLVGATGATGPSGIPGIGIPGMDGIDADQSLSVPFPWSAVLNAGNRSGGSNAFMDIGQFMNFGVDGPSAGNPQIRSGDAVFRIRGGAITTVGGATGAVFFASANTAELAADAGNVLLSTSTVPRLSISSSGEWTTPTGGALGNVLTHQGAGVPPLWVAPAAGSGSSGPGIPGMDGQDGEASGVIIQQVSNNTNNTVAGSPESGITLSATTHSLEVVTTVAGDVDFEVSFQDATSSTITPGSNAGSIATATTTTAVSAPAASTQRTIVEMNILNSAAANQTVTVQKDVSGTNFLVWGPGTLAPQERLEFTQAMGWRVFLATGAEKGPSPVVDVFSGNAITVNGTVDLTGSTSTINITPTSGSLGTVDISTLRCGGLLSYQNVTADATIDGFTAPANDGFWFILNVRDATTSFVIKLQEDNAGTAADGIRTPDIRDLRLYKNDSVIMFYSNSRWRSVATMPRLFLSGVEIVTFAAQENDHARPGSGVNHMRVSLTGSQTLTGLVPDQSVNGSPNGEICVITNLDTIDTLTIAQASTSSVASNRFNLPLQMDMPIGPQCSVAFHYDATSSRWRPLMDVSRLFLSGVDSVTISAAQNDYTRPSTSQNVIRVDLTGSQGMSGVVPSSSGSPNGELLVIENIDTSDVLLITHEGLGSAAANRFALPDGVTYLIGPGSAGIFAYDGTSQRWRLIGGSERSTYGSGGLLKVTTYNTGTAASHNWNASTRTAILDIVGSGGGGGNAPAAAAGQSSFGSGGGSGTWARVLYTISTASLTYTVPAATAANANGAVCSVTDGTNSVSCPGGGVGGATAAGAAVETLAGGLGGAGPTIVGTGFQLLNAATTGTCQGNSGGFAFRLGTTIGMSGAGAPSPFSGGLAGGNAAQNNGTFGPNPGSGGSGGFSANGAGARTGGGASAGVIVIYEYS